MGRKNKVKWVDIPADQLNPLAYAVATRDKSVIDMVENAVHHKQVMLAF